MTNHSNPCQIIKIDKQTNKIDLPDILLETRSGEIIGKISKYENFNSSLVGIGIDEVSFDVCKYVDGKKCPIWDDLIDLKLIELTGYGRFQIKVNYADNAKTVKAILGKSLEVELGQLYLNEFHVNDDEATDMVVTDYSKGNYDNKGNFIPTVFCNFEDEEHSLLHRVLKDKAPHWSIGNVPTYVSMSEDAEAELSNKFQRTYTENGTSIYDFLTDVVAQETNVVFIFDTFERKIHCYNLFDCYKNGKIVESGIGDDTLVFASKKNFLNEVSIESNQDQVKNCFRVEGGDDTITAMIAAVNMNGTNYIWKFSDFQLSDMSEELQKAIKDYQEEMSLQSTKDEYYGENGIYTKLCEAYEQLYLKESTMMPSLTTVEVGTAEEQYNNVVSGLNTSTVYVSNINNYSSSAFTGVTNQVESYATILMDSRFEIEVVEGSTSFSYDKETDTYGTWKGKIKITQKTDETNTYPVIIENSAYISVKIGNGNTVDGEIEYMRQKVQKALAKQDMTNLDFSYTDSDKEIRSYFEQFSLNRLKSFYDAYNECISILAELVSTNKSDIAKDLYDEYYKVLAIIDEVKNTRQKEVDIINSEISILKDKQMQFQNDHNFQKHLEKYGENLYKEFCMYRREDTYSNPNYASDSLETTTELLNKAKELMEVADSELSKACMLQRTVSTSLSNLLILPEFEPLYDSFALFNYIRVKTDDEILKLRLIGVDFSGDSIENINVTFSEKVESVDGKEFDTESILQQAASIATSYSSTVKQAKQGESANKEFIDIYANGLNATKAMLSNNDSNEVTMTGAGLIAKRMDDEGFYGDKQLRIVGNGMYLTDDAWKSLKMAVGEIIYINPITGEEEKKYGIIASTIIGELIAGKQMHIGNENGSVLITGDGIKISKGTIEWGDVNSPTIDDIPELTDSLNEVDLHLEQLDGRIQTFSQIDDPSLNWTNDEKKNHISDLWVNPETGLTKQWTGTTWIVVTDENLKKLASSKAQIFTSQPTTPYYVGDLWVQGSTGDIMHCKITKVSGDFESDDWVISSKYTNNDELYEFIEGDFKETVSDIGTKIDGKADTFYQADSPHAEYMNVNQNSTYDLWVGDMWYDTDTGETFMYQRTDLGSNKYNYEWKFMDIPDEVFDIIDTKKTIYTALPTNYNKDDMYILEVNRGSWKKGTILNATATATNQTTFNTNHWKENVRYTDDSYIQEWIDGEYQENLTQINKQIDQRAQTWYKTKSEMDAEVATWTDKSIHVGDLWYRTDVSEGEDQTFVYTSSYTWEVMNGVPKDIFDMADGKCSLYVTKPTTGYKKNDMWILEVENENGSNSTYPKYKKGTLLVSNYDNTSYSSTDWEEKVNYSAELEKFVSDYDDELTKIQNQVDGKARAWYQSDDPVNNEEWDTTENHEGDLWYDTDSTSQITYIYKNGWQPMSVPKTVFDQIDGKNTIYTTLPLPTGSIAQDGDLLIPTGNVTYSGITYKAKKVYKYIGGYWIEIDYTDKTYVNDELNKVKDDIKNYSDGNLEEFNKLVAKYLGFDGSTTLIDANYIISPKIYGGYAYFTKGNYSIEIDPNHGAGSNTLDNYLFCIRNKTNNSVIMGVDINGNGYFSGSITASTISGSTFETTSSSGFTKITNGYVNVGENDGENDTIYGRLDYGTFNSLKGIGLVNLLPNGGYIGLGHTEENKTIIDYWIDSSDFDNISHHFYGNINVNSNITVDGSINVDSIYMGNQKCLLSGLSTTESTGGIQCNGVFSTTGKLLVGNASLSNNSILDVNGNAFINGKLLFGDGSAGLYYSNDANDLYTIGALGVNGTAWNGYALGVNGSTYINNNLFVNGTTTLKGNISLASGWTVNSTRVYTTSAGQMGSGGSEGIFLVSGETGKDYIHVQDGVDDIFRVDYNGSVYSADGELSTSDRNKKHDIYTISEKYEKLFEELKPVTYIFNNKIRTHVGYIAQDVEESLKNNNIDTSEFAGYWREQKWKEKDDGNIEYLFDDEGNPIYDCGLRYSEFIALNTHMIQKTRNENKQLKQQLQNQKQEIDSLKESVSILMQQINQGQN